ncbi:SDR family NAD(P)-dependent oxidoreductase [Pacificibacter marinus]|uniref:Levodione reductase n=1 Tax=Pacificibacter marinus TaxID=658057 RepID=A0A1Y5TPF5_9RHOB|nr:SDR family oxidoreductase [Pacificibacter marinus]SEL24915.1 NAD(P)-dependent dehydrogenase, short-chain alcohol dehydrogenase family [Pacificibacter marinus]SLN65012.1 Levodione reductase [Pacificibacter marinus]
MFDLKGKVCLITGGAGSLGLAAARLLHHHGARLALVDLDLAALDTACAEVFGKAADDVLCIAADVTDETQVRRAVARTVDRFGLIDVLISNAGTFGTVAPIEDYPTEVFDSVMAVHVRGAFLLAKHGVPHMNKGGSIVLTSSVAATRGDPGVYAYITAKHALTGLMRVLAKDLAPRGIRVNAIAPGPIANGFQKRVEDGLGAEIGRDGTAFFDEIIPMGRHGTADEIAASMLYLASSQSSFTTGHVLMADGGMSA